MPQTVMCPQLICTDTSNYNHLTGDRYLYRSPAVNPKGFSWMYPPAQPQEKPAQTYPYCAVKAFQALFPRDQNNESGDHGIR